MMRILADENIDRPIVHWLREQGHEVAEVVALAPGASDEEVVGISRREKRILMTFDRDIGRFVLSSDDVHPGVIYLRLRGNGPQLWARFRQVWPDVEHVAPGRFVTVRNRQIRRRPLLKATGR